IDLIALEKYLQSLGNPLALKGDDTKLGPELDALIGSMPDKRITVDVGHGGISIDGHTLTISGPCTESWPVQGMPGGLKLKLSTATITLTDEGVTGALIAAKLPLTANVSATVDVRPGQNAVWEAQLTADAAGVTPTELIALGLAGPLPFEVP